MGDSKLHSPDMVRTPDVFSLVSGASEGPYRLNAFDNALLRAGVGDTNLVRMSSILPPGARRTAPELLRLPKGGLIPLAYGAYDSEDPGAMISAAVAVGIPEDPSQAGVIMEHEGHASLAETERIVKDMVRHAFDSRGRALKEILSIGAEHTVVNCGAVFAAVVLWYSGGKP